MSTEGKSVDELIAQTNGTEGPMNSLLQLIKGIIELLFPKSQAFLSSGRLKIHVDEISHEELIALGGVAKDNPDTNISLRRSGTGITILFELKK